MMSVIGEDFPEDTLEFSAAEKSYRWREASSRANLSLAR